MIWRVTEHLVFIFVGQLLELLDVPERPSLLRPDDSHYRTRTIRRSVQQEMTDRPQWAKWAGRSTVDPIASPRGKCSVFVGKFIFFYNRSYWTDLSRSLPLRSIQKYAPSQVESTLRIQLRFSEIRVRIRQFVGRSRRNKWL